MDKFLLCCCCKLPVDWQSLELDDILEEEPLVSITISLLWPWETIWELFNTLREVEFSSEQCELLASMQLQAVSLSISISGGEPRSRWEPSLSFISVTSAPRIGKLTSMAKFCSYRWMNYCAAAIIILLVQNFSKRSTCSTIWYWYYFWNLSLILVTPQIRAQIIFLMSH